MTFTASSSSRAVTDSPVVVALDYSNRDKALAFVDRIDPRDCRLKVGKEMFTLFGPQLVRDLQQRGFDVFLDLKFHDIPNTTAHAVAAAAELGVWMVNVHASGGARMMVTPGIRPEGSEAGDQRRIMTPEQAQSAGVDYMVIGRPVTQSADPAQTLKMINASLKRGA